MRRLLLNSRRKLRRLVRQAQTQPQTITEGGQKAVLMSLEHYKALTQQNSPTSPQTQPQQQQSLVEMLRASPHREIDLTPERLRDVERDATLE
jgi:prevent-host-death family protein